MDVGVSGGVEIVSVKEVPLSADALSRGDGEVDGVDDEIATMLIHVGDLGSLRALPLRGPRCAVKGLAIRWMEGVDFKQFNGTLLVSCLEGWMC